MCTSTSSLLYVSTNTRPDIALAVSRIARYVTRPTKEIIRAAKHVVKYLHATEDRGLHIRPANGAATELSVDASWLGEFQKHGNPRYGFVCKTAGSPITWKTSYVSHVCLSTCEAEYCALSLATKEALHIQQLQAEFRGVTAEYEMLRTGELPMVRESTKAFNVYEHIEGHAPNNTRVHNEETQRLEQARQLMAKITVLIKEDNLPATHAVKNAHGSFLRLRHIAAHYHRVRELHEMGIIRVVHVPGKEQEADFLTKTNITETKFKAVANTLTSNVKPAPKDDD